MTAKRGRTISTFGQAFTPIGITGSAAVIALIALILKDRSLDLTLRPRSVALTVEARTTTLTLPERD